MRGLMDRYTQEIIYRNKRRHFPALHITGVEWSAVYMNHIAIFGAGRVGIV